MLPKYKNEKLVFFYENQLLYVKELKAIWKIREGLKVSVLF